MTFIDKTFGDRTVEGCSEEGDRDFGKFNEDHIAGEYTTQISPLIPSKSAGATAANCEAWSIIYNTKYSQKNLPAWFDGTGENTTSRRRLREQDSALESLRRQMDDMHDRHRREINAKNEQIKGFRKELDELIEAAVMESEINGESTMEKGKPRENHTQVPGYMP